MLAFIRTLRKFWNTPMIKINDVLSVKWTFHFLLSISMFSHLQIRFASPKQHSKTHNVIKATALKSAMFYWVGQNNRYLICYTFAQYGSQGWCCTTLRLLYVFLETLTMAPLPDCRNITSPWQTFAHVSEKQLPKGSLLPLKLQSLPNFLICQDIGEYKLSWNWGHLA